MVTIVTIMITDHGKYNSRRREHGNNRYYSITDHGKYSK
jgi:hypothetical protein